MTLPKKKLHNWTEFNYFLPRLSWKKVRIQIWFMNFLKYQLLRIMQKKIVELLITKIHFFDLCMCLGTKLWWKKNPLQTTALVYLCYDRIVYGQTFYKVWEKMGCKNELSHSIFFLMPLKVIHTKYYKHLKKAAQNSHLDR